MNTKTTVFMPFYLLNRLIAQRIQARAAPILIVFTLAFIACTNAVWAGPGHDHGDAPAAAVGTASPRVSAHSDLFELVGTVDSGELKIHLDRYATNEPVLDAKIEVEAGRFLSHLPAGRCLCQPAQ